MVSLNSHKRSKILQHLNIHFAKLFQSIQKIFPNKKNNFDKNAILVMKIIMITFKKFLTLPKIIF